MAWASTDGGVERLTSRAADEESVRLVVVDVQQDCSTVSANAVCRVRADDRGICGASTVCSMPVASTTLRLGRQFSISSLFVKHGVLNSENKGPAGAIGGFDDDGSGACCSEAGLIGDDIGDGVG
jgi:hypothetical protein